MKREDGATHYTWFEEKMAALFSQMHCPMSGPPEQEVWWPRIQELKAAAVKEWQEERQDARAQSWRLLLLAGGIGLFWAAIAQVLGASWPMAAWVGTGTALLAVFPLAWARK